MLTAAMDMLQNAGKLLLIDPSQAAVSLVSELAKPRKHHQ